MNHCSSVRDQFSNYIDGALTGVAMQRIAAHMGECGACRRDFDAWRFTQNALADLGPAKPPADLSLRLRVAISNERARGPRNSLSILKVRWQNTIAPLLLQASAGFASAIVLVGTVALLIGMIATPEPLAARDEPLGMASAPRFLYSSVETSTSTIGDRDNPVVVEAYVDGSGRVYDYEIVSGPSDVRTRSQLDNLLLFSVFDPARSFGQPVRGLAVLSFAGVSVQG